MSSQSQSLQGLGVGPVVISITSTVDVRLSATVSLLPSATTTLIIAVTHTPSTVASAPKATHGPSATLIGAVLGGIMFFLVFLIIMLLRSRRNAALFFTQTETHAGSRSWHALGRIFHTRPPTDTTPFRPSEAETGAGRGAVDLNHKQDMASHALPVPVTPPPAMPARSEPGQVSDGHSVHQSVTSEDQLPSYKTVGTPSEDTPLI
ncbi:hypothetical protein JB92DRAFT_2926131 [Gautieria morchelliformis]|nr:hypothetical protein JB92DRAFT_2926131 [Gautieria morchelliformis]